jgi:hypothetical protein
VLQVDAPAQEVNPEINPSIVHEGSASSQGGSCPEPRTGLLSPPTAAQGRSALGYPPPGASGLGLARRGEGRMIVTAGAGHRVFAISPTGSR